MTVRRAVRDRDVLHGQHGHDAPSLTSRKISNYQSVVLLMRDLLDMWYEAAVMGLGEAMVAARRIIALSVDADQRRVLVEIARSRTEPANRVERAGIILAYLNEPSA
jgi:hypothetical protein